MNPFFFGSSDCPLFGAYYAPAESRGLAALLAYPVGHEYMRSHWAFRQLATRLEQGGVHTLRFDYRGTGDSGGEPSLAAWRADLAIAAKELRDVSGVRRLVVIGARMGATMVALEAAELGAEHIILWDPIVSGGAYNAAMQNMHRRALRDPDRFDEARGEAPGERLGYPWPPELDRAISAVALAEITPPVPVTLVCSRRQSCRGLVNAWTQAGVHCEYREADDDCAWSSIASLEDQLLAPLLIATLASIAIP